MKVNSIRNKFVSTQEVIKSTFDLFLIIETKVDDSFPNAQFKMEGYKSFRKDRDAFGGGLLFYDVDLDCRSLEICPPNTFIEILPWQLRFLNSNWLILGTYKSPPQNEPTYVSEIQKLLTYYLSSYDNMLLLRDFNMPFSNKKLNPLIEDPTYLKSSNPSFINNFYNNKKTTFFDSFTDKNGTSGHQSLICTTLWSRFCNGPAKFIYYRSYNNYNKEKFENVFKKRLVSSSNFEEFFDKFLATLNESTQEKFDIIIKFLGIKHLTNLSWNNLSYKIHSTRKDLLKTGKVLSDSVISVQMY